MNVILVEYMHENATHLHTQIFSYYNVSEAEECCTENFVFNLT